MLGLAVLMITLLAFPLWCMVGAADITDASSASTPTDPGADGAPTHPPASQAERGTSSRIAAHLAVEDDGAPC